jgi:hypothetical protein
VLDYSLEPRLQIVDRFRSIFIVGRLTPDALELSYARAFRNLGLQVTTWDVPRAIAGYTRLGKFGKFVNRFWPLENWTAKANDDLLTAILDARPDIVAVVGINRVSAGTVAQIKTSLPHCQVILVWPDPLVYCPALTVASIPVFDMVATYSQASIEPLHRLGARRAEWVPFAYDPDLHPSPLNSAEKPSGAVAGLSEEFDVSFVGAHTLERETVVRQLVENGFRVALWGPNNWGSCRVDKRVRGCYKGGPIVGADLAAAVRSAKVSLNPIRRTNFPGANMRFFEIPGSGGVQLAGACPEMEAEFPDRECCLYYDYYNRVPNVAEVLRSAMKDEDCLSRVAKNSRARILQSHTYSHRARHILELLETERAEKAAVAGDR